MDQDVCLRDSESISLFNGKLRSVRNINKNCKVIFNNTLIINCSFYGTALGHSGLFSAAFLFPASKTLLLVSSIAIFGNYGQFFPSETFKSGILA